MNDDYTHADTIFEHVSYYDRSCARFYLWRILKNKLCASNLCTEDNMKGIIQDVMSFCHRRSERKECVLDVTSVCEPKATNCITLYKYADHKLILTDLSSRAV